MNLEIELVMIEVSLHLLAIDIVDVHIHDSEAASPFLVAIGEVGFGRIEYVVDEREVIFNLLVPLNVEAVGGLINSGFEIRHD